jgi:glucose-6-phosphate 1-dehydrogenase
MPTHLPTVLIIIGITGDLAQRKLLPAIAEIAAAGELPEKFRIVGISRRSGLDLESVLGAGAAANSLRACTHLYQMDLTHSGDYQKLAQYLETIDTELGGTPQRLFYLSIPPTVSRPIIEMLGESGLATQPNTKLLLEKPFGVDLASAQELVQHIDQYFSFKQVYRIDHYLAKETAQNFIVFRENNSLFKRSWNKDFIESIEVIASEEIGIEGRATFYEQTGALRDVVQSHMLELAALTLMETSTSGSFFEVPARRLDALKQLQLPSGEEITSFAKRGQYVGYADEVQNPDTIVETFVSLRLQSTDPRWEGVPITLTTGKMLDKKLTQIKIKYKRDHGYEANELVIQMQPDEGVELEIWTKQPGFAHLVSQHALRFNYKEHYSKLPEAYEQVLFNAMISDHSLFTSSAEVLETWRILDPVQQYWEMTRDDLVQYQPHCSISEVLAQS